MNGVLGMSALMLDTDLSAEQMEMDEALAAIYDGVLGEVGIHTRAVEGKILVVNVWDPELRGQGISPGMEIVKINGQPTRQFAETKIAPYQSASTPQDRSRSCRRSSASSSARTGSSRARSPRSRRCHRPSARTRARPRTG